MPRTRAGCELPSGAWPIHPGSGRVSQRDLEPGRAPSMAVAPEDAARLRPQPVPSGCLEGSAKAPMALSRLCPWQASLIDGGCVLVLRAVTTSR